MHPLLAYTDNLKIKELLMYKSLNNKNVTTY